MEYNRDEIVATLRAELAYIDEADDRGSVDFALSRLQELFASLDSILDEHGGI